MPIVRMPDGQLVDLPDNPDPKQLAELQLVASPTATPKKRSGWEELGRQLGLTARIPVHIATGTAGVLTDAATGLYNEGMNRFAPGKGPRFPTVTPALNKLMTQLGLPEPETGLEHAVQFGGTLFGGGADPFARMATKGATAVPKVISSENLVAKELADAGIPLLPSQAARASGTKNVGTRFIEGTAGVDRANTILREKAQPALQQLAAKATGLKPETITSKALDAANRSEAHQGYEPIKKLGQLYFGRGSSHSFQAKLSDIAIKNRSIEQSEQIAKRVEDLRSYANGRIPADAALDHIKQLRSDATDAFRNNNTNYAKALREMADAMEAQIERNIPKGSPLLENFRAARTQIAKNNAVKDMLVDKDTGIIDVRKAQKLKADGVKLTGELDTIAKAGSDMFSASTQPPIKGPGPAWTWGDSMFAMGSGGLGALFAGPIGIGAAAIPPIARAGAKHLVASGPVQRSLAKKLGPQAANPYLTPEVMQAMKLGALPPLFSMGEQ